VGTGVSPVQAEHSSALIRVFAVHFVGAATILASLISPAAAQTPPWRYDLRPGDHLTYRYTFHRKVQNDGDQYQIESRFRTHVLVLAAEAERITIGFQRNREAADMTEYRSKGKDRLAKERIDFQKRMQKRPSHFSEGMEISPSGEPSYPWEIARETSSNLIRALHEVMSLPPANIARGASWHSNSESGLDFRWAGDESIHDKMCHRIDASTPDGSLKLTYWGSPESGVLERVDYEANYQNSGPFQETARMELESRQRDEPIESWLASADTRLAALQALLQTNTTPISAVLLTPALTSGEPAAQSLALAVALARKIDLPSDTLNQLRQSGSSLVQTELKLLTESSPMNSLKTSSSSPSLDECHRSLPAKSPPIKRGTVFEVSPATKDNPAISYLLRIPLTYSEARPSPLLVVLSGGAGFAMDGMNSSDDAVSTTDYLVLYPQAAAYWWTPEVARRFDVVLRDVLERYNVDRDRIYLTGFSNGGTGSLYFATLWPHRFAAVVSLMGAGQCNEKVKAALPNLRNLPLLFIHGENDPIITPDCSTTTHAALTELNPAVKPELKILPNHGHDITLDNDDGLALAFFKDKVRNPFPRTVDLIETDALAARAYWVEIVDGKPGKSDIDARIKPDSAGSLIEIHSHDVKSIRLHLRPELFLKPGEIRIVWNGKKVFTGALRDYCSLASSATADPKLDLTDPRVLTLP
jgi:pimeloyl-ACP methyl ester carboxylesterase